MNSFGQVIPVRGPNLGFVGNISRVGERVTSSKQAIATGNPIPFGAPVVDIGDTTGGKWQSVADFIAANPANASLVSAQFAGVAIRNVKTDLAFVTLNQAAATTAQTTATAALGASTLVVALATGIQVGQSVEGAGVQPNTLVTTVAGTSIGISLPTTAALAGAAVIFTAQMGTQVGSYAPGSMCEALERGSITVLLSGTGIPVQNAPVYIRTAVDPNVPGSVVGGFEAAASTPINVNASATIGTAVITPVSMVGIAVGQIVTGAGIPLISVIISTTGTTFTINQNVTAALSATPITVTSSMAIGLPTPYSPAPMVFRTGDYDPSYGVVEITIKERRAA